MQKEVVNIKEKFSKFSEQWSPKIIAQMNNYQFKIARVEGDFVWHDHKDTDEVFIVIEGKLRIDFRKGNVVLNEGEMFVVPQGIEHKPFAEKECKILLVEPASTLNTGDVKNKQTTEKDAWL